MTDIPVIAGVDYALRRASVALVRGEELVFTMAYDFGRDVAPRVAVLTHLVMAWREDYGPVAVYLERPFVNRFTNSRGETKQNIGTALDLARVVGHIEGIAVAAGHRVTLVAPDSWRSAVMLAPISRGRDDKKAAAIRTVEMVYGRRVGHDEADAILLARYGAGVEKRGAMVKAAG